jgi:anaerobic selenocysteine-containing dehydrogenase
MIDHSAGGDVDVFWMVGGNFLETLPDPRRSHDAMVRPKLRVHQDIVLSSAMLVEGDGDVVLLPALTRYESPGGGTETSTERRIIFSPEIPGRRIGSARPEWWVFGEVMARVKPESADLIRFADAASIRQEIARAISLYQGIETLHAKGDQIQWGGRTLYSDGRFATPDGKARFSTISPRPNRRAHWSSAQYAVSTRRGKQFNSMVQRSVDPLTGAARDDIFISRDDLTRLALRSGDRVRLRSACGSFTGRVREASIRPGILEVHWPEGNTLLAAGTIDPDSLEPDFNAIVTIERG